MEERGALVFAGTSPPAPRARASAAFSLSRWRGVVATTTEGFRRMGREVRSPESITAIRSSSRWIRPSEWESRYQTRGDENAAAGGLVEKPRRMARATSPLAIALSASGLELLDANATNSCDGCAARIRCAIGALGAGAGPASVGRARWDTKAPCCSAERRSRTVASSAPIAATTTKTTHLQMADDPAGERAEPKRAACHCQDRFNSSDVATQAMPRPKRRWAERR